jgi:hypothetical protein
LTTGIWDSIALFFLSVCSLYRFPQRLLFCCIHSFRKVLQHFRDFLHGVFRKRKFESSLRIPVQELFSRSFVGGALKIADVGWWYVCRRTR